MYGLLFDARDATTNTTVADVHTLAGRLAGATVKEGQRGPVAVVATDDAFYGMAKIYQSVRTTSEPACEQTVRRYGP